MAENKSTQHSVEARLLAALAHGSVVVQGIGLIVGIVVYVNQREKSRFAAFQALQAAVFQLIGMIVIVGLWLVWGVFYGLSMIPLVNMGETDVLPPIFWISMGSMVIPFLAMIVIGAYGLWAAIRTWQGRDFRYPILGSWLERSGLWQQITEQE
jgi:uncharacterized Tic20 family protein